MAVEVRLTLRHALRGPVARASLAGDGLLVRLRSTTIAILGVVAAIGLALVAIASQMGWPSVLSGPLPQTPEAFARNATIVAPASPSSHRSTTGHGRQRRDRATAPVFDAPRRTSELTAANPVESPVAAPPASQQPSAPKAQGHESPSSPTPAQTPEVAPTQSPDDEPGSGEASPPESKAPSPPVAAAPESSPGHSGESHGNHYGQGPPPWAGSGSSDSSSGDGSWDHGHDDDDGGGWDHH